MAERSRPPDDITPHDFFTAWVPASVAADAGRRSKLGDTRAALVFEVTGVERSVYTLHIADGAVRGEPGAHRTPDLHVVVDVETWRGLNRGELTAPEALVARRVRLTGDFVLALKLHWILG